MAVKLFDLYQNFMDEGIIFCFCGPASQSIVEGIGDALMQKMEREEADRSMSRKVFAVFVEQMQNVVFHSAEVVSGGDDATGQMGYGVVVVGREDECFFVRSGNYVKRRDADRISEQLERIRTMDKVQLKQFFKEQRKKEMPESSKGAGLGFIDTARKASRPIEFKITPGHGDMVFFSLKVII